jgi:hypothetical protein
MMGTVIPSTERLLLARQVIHLSSPTTPRKVVSIARQTASKQPAWLRPCTISSGQFLLRLPHQFITPVIPLHFSRDIWLLSSQHGTDCILYHKLIMENFQENLAVSLIFPVSRKRAPCLSWTILARTSRELLREY